jgi:CBS-domain-containing membrane protein
VVILTGAGWSFLALPILAGTVGLVLAAIAYHRCITHHAYPA